MLWVKQFEYGIHAKRFFWRGRAGEGGGGGGRGGEGWKRWVEGVGG